MSIKFFLRRGTDAEHSGFTGDAGEITLDTTNYRIKMHDGVTVGGIPVANLNDVVAASTLEGLSDVTITSPTNVQVLRYSTGTWVNGALAIADITNLQTTLNGKAATSHTHTTANITDLSSYTGFDARYYTEGETDTLLAGKANASHTHVIADVTGLQTALDGKAAVSHAHGNADITDLAWGKLTGVPSTFPPSAHTHTSGDVTDFTEAVQDVVGAALVAGTGISVAYDDPSGTITIAYTGSGGGGATSLDGLSDVTITTPATAQVLRYNGTLFVNAALVIGDVSGLQTALDGKASTTHTHVAADITDLSSYTGFDARYYTESETDTLLAGKSDVGHTHALNDLSDVTITAPSNGQVLKYNGSAWVNGTDSTGGGGSSVSSARLAFFGSF